MERAGQLRSQGDSRGEVKVAPAMICSDGDTVRQWLLAGCGIALKSYTDISADLQAGRLTLTLVLDKLDWGLSPGDTDSVGLHLLYPCHRFQPKQVQGFIEFFVAWMEGRARDRPGPAPL